MKKFGTILLSLACVLSLLCMGLFGRDNRPDIPEDFHADSIIMLYSENGDVSSEKVIITSEETISELLTMHRSLRTQEQSRPISDERMWMIFTDEDAHVIEWCISVYGDDWNHAEFITCSNTLGIGNHVVKSEFNYERLVEIFREAMN